MYSFMGHCGNFEFNTVRKTFQHIELHCEQVACISNSRQCKEVGQHEMVEIYDYGVTEIANFI